MTLAFILRNNALYVNLMGDRHLAHVIVGPSGWWAENRDPAVTQEVTGLGPKLMLIDRRVGNQNLHASG